MVWELHIYKSFAVEIRPLVCLTLRLKGRKISLLKSCKKQLLSVLFTNYCNVVGWILQQMCFIGTGLTTACWDCAPKEVQAKLDLYRAVI